MLVSALLLIVLAGQDAPSPAAPAPGPEPELYAPPVVQPYTPPSSFGRQIAEGDADATVRRRPIPAPVALDAYRDNYERRRSRRELSYEEGVAQALGDADARMGPLDGRWRVVGPRGEALLDLDLFDRGCGRAVEGALSLAGAHGTSDMGVVTSVARDPGGALEIVAAIDGGAVRLRLEPVENGWMGVMSTVAEDAASDRAVSRDRRIAMVRPG